MPVNIHLNTTIRSHSNATHNLWIHRGTKLSFFFCLLFLTCKALFGGKELNSKKHLVIRSLSILKMSSADCFLVGPVEPWHACMYACTHTQTIRQLLKPKTPWINKIIDLKLLSLMQTHTVVVWILKWSVGKYYLPRQKKHLDSSLLMIMMAAVMQLHKVQKFDWELNSCGSTLSLSKTLQKQCLWFLVFNLQTMSHMLAPMHWQVMAMCAQVSSMSTELMQTVGYYKHAYDLVVILFSHCTHSM